MRDFRYEMNPVPWKQNCGTLPVCPVLELRRVSAKQVLILDNNTEELKNLFPNLSLCCKPNGKRVETCPERDKRDL
jgi:hypothetical protein